MRHCRFLRTLAAALLCAPVLASATVTLTLTSPTPNVRVGDDVELVATVGNASGSPLQGHTLRLFFLIDPNGNARADYLGSAPTGCVANTAAGQPTVDCPLPTIANGASASVTVQARATAESTFFLVPVALVADAGGDFLEEAPAQNLRAFTQVDVARNIDTDTDGDGVGDVAEDLLGFPADNPFLTPSAPEVDLLVYYTPGSSAALDGGDPVTRINHLLTVANSINQASGLGARYRLRGTLLVNDPEGDSNGAALTRMRDRSGVFANLDADRASVGADVVLLMRPQVSGSGSCGLAFVLGVGVSDGGVAFRREGDIGFASNGSNALGTVNINCRERTTAHELGHIMGLGHDRLDSGSNGTRVWARGHGQADPDGFVTVMGLASNYSLFSNDEVNLFSTPSISSCGASETRPCGIARSNPQTGAEAATSLTQTAFLASVFHVRDQDGDGVPDDQDAFPDAAGERFDSDGDGIGNNADNDDDNDALSDAEELAAGLNPLDPADADGDPDGDGWSSRDELAFGADPTSAASQPDVGSSIITRIIPRLQGG